MLRAGQVVRYIIVDDLKKSKKVPLECDGPAMPAASRILQSLVHSLLLAVMHIFLSIILKDYRSWIIDAKTLKIGFAPHTTFKRRL